MIELLLNSPYLFGALLILLVVASLIIIGFVVFGGANNDNSGSTVKYHQTGINGISGKGNKYTRYNGSDR